MTGGVDVIRVGDGNNTIFGGTGGDTITSGQGIDTIFGDNGSVTLDATAAVFVRIVDCPESSLTRIRRSLPTSAGSICS